MAIIPVEDPNRRKYRVFGFQLDRILIGQAGVGKVHWRTLWIRKCRNAVMASDRGQLEQLIAISEIARSDSCQLGSEDSRTGSGW